MTKDQNKLEFFICFNEIANPMINGRH